MRTNGKFLNSVTIVETAFQPCLIRMRSDLGGVGIRMGPRRKYQIVYKMHHLYYL